MCAPLVLWAPSYFLLPDVDTRQLIIDHHRDVPAGGIAAEQPRPRHDRNELRRAVRLEDHESAS